MIKKLLVGTIGSLTMSLFSANAIAAEKLVINSMHSDPAPREAFEKIVTKFKKAHPGIDVKVNTTAHEAFKIQLKTWLPNNPPDIVSWFGGNRAAYFARKGLILPIDDIWKDVGADFGDGAKSVSRVDDKYYLMPTSYYHWGFYYRKDLFKKAGITQTPKTWSEFKVSIEKLKKSGVTPITIGAKNAWPAAAWFDFINMRVNGFQFHMDLLHGKESYQQQKVYNTMEKWKELVDMGAYTKAFSGLSWQEGATLLWQGKASMYLMGNFISPDIPKNLKGKIGFFPFPKIADIPQSEVAPTDVFFIPAKAKNVDNAKKFMRFLASKEIQEEYNIAHSLLPPNNKAKTKAGDEFLEAGKKLLDNASALGQFYDRDSEPKVAKEGMKAFLKFLKKPADYKKHLKRVEKERVRSQKGK